MTRATSGLAELLSRVTQGGGADGGQPLAPRAPLAALAAAVDTGELVRGALLEAFGAGLDGAVAFADACAELRADPDRGAHHTPWPVARWLAAEARGGKGGGSELERVLDPACGVGHLLLGAHGGGVPRRPERWMGWDVDAESVAAARLALWLADGGVGSTSDYAGVRCVDPLVEAAGGGPRGDLPLADLVVANPPFLSVRSLTRTHGADYVAALRRAAPALRGNFDLYTPFLLLLERWMAPRGRFAVIVPATLWTARYAASARAALAPRIEAVHSLFPEGTFPGRAVHTDVVVGCAGGTEWAELRRTDPLAGASQRQRRVPSESLRDGLPGPATAASVPLGALAEVSAGTPGYRAADTAAALREARDDDGPELLPFVVTRSVRPYALEVGAVRFLGERYRRPVLDPGALTPGKRALFESPKVLVGGVSRGLVAAPDTRGVAMGVGVYAVLPRGISAACVLALLNAPCVAEWYRERFRGRRLSGGYWAVNSTNLREVPVPRRWLDDGARREAVEAIVRARIAALSAPEIHELERSIDAMVREDLFGSR